MTEVDCGRRRGLMFITLMVASSLVTRGVALSRVAFSRISRRATGGVWRSQSSLRRASVTEPKVVEALDDSEKYRKTVCCARVLASSR